MEKVFYFAQVFGGLRTTFSVILVVTAVASLFLLAGWGCAKEEGDNDDVKVFSKYFKISIITAFVSALMVVFVPSKETYLLMVGGRVVDETIENNPQIKELPGNTIDLLNEYIKTATSNLKEKQNKE